MGGEAIELLFNLNWQLFIKLLEFAAFDQYGDDLKLNDF
jgi:hypothetical protein